LLRSSIGASSSGWISISSSPFFCNYFILEMSHGFDIRLIVRLYGIIDRAMSQNKSILLIGTDGFLHAFLFIILHLRTSPHFFNRWLIQIGYVLHRSRILGIHVILHNPVVQSHGCDDKEIYSVLHHSRQVVAPNSYRQVD
jgi:hypothetical protein